MRKTTRGVLLAWPVLALSPQVQAAGAAASSDTLLDEVVIQTSRAKAGYRVETLDSIGPLGTTPLTDVPYSISVLPSDLIQNTQAVNFKEVSKYMPLVSYQEQQGPDILRPMTRGFQGSNFQNTKIDGMTIFMTGTTAMEQFDQIEVVSGTSAALYGPAPPSGMFNMITKRPTDYSLREMTATYASGRIGTAKMDLGGHLDSKGIVGYRLNALYGGGEGFVNDSHEHRTLLDLGVDVHPLEHTVLQLNYSNNELKTRGFPGWFTYSQSILLPQAPDPGQAGIGQPYAGVKLHTIMGEARIKQDFGANWHLVAGVLNENVHRNINTAVNNLRSNAGAYNTNYASGFAPRFAITSDVAYLNGNFSTWGIGHDLTIGSAGYRASSYGVRTPAVTTCPPSATSTCLGSANVNAPVIFPEPAQGPPQVGSGFIYRSSVQYQQGINFNDTLKFTDHWQLRLGASQDWFHTNNFNTSGTKTSEYRNHGVSPTASAIFKPTADSSLYATWQSSLLAGDLAPAGATNAGATLQPYRSRQYEVGYKLRVGKVDFTTALFDIRRPFANVNPPGNAFGISGQQVNRGLEVSATGQVIDGLTTYAGITLLNSRMHDTPLATTDGRRYVGTAKVKGNALFEYHIRSLPGLVAIFDYQFAGSRPGDDTNQFMVKGYNLFDVGGRYTSKMWGMPVAWRLAVKNITDRHYWSTIGPSNLTAANTGNLVAHLGTPRTLDASVSIRF